MALRSPHVGCSEGSPAGPKSGRSSTGRILAIFLALAAAPAASAQQPKAVVGGDAGVRREVEGHLARVEQAIGAGDLRAAIAAAEAADRSSARLKDPRTPLRIQSLITLAEVRGAAAIAARKFDDARAQMEYAVKIGRDFLKPGDPSRIRSRLVLAELLLAMDGDREAMEQYEAAAREAEPFPAYRAGRIRALLMAAHLGLERDPPDPGQVDRLAVEAQRLRQQDPKGMEGPLRSVALEAWGRLLRRAQAASGEAGNPDVGAIDERLRLSLDRSRALLERVGARPGLAGGGLLWLLRFRYERKRFDAAEEVLAELAKREESLRGEPDFLAEYWSFLGLLRSERGDFAAAREAHEKELALRKEHHLGQESRTLNSLGLLFLRLGDYRAAEEVLEEAVGIYASDPLLKNDPLRPVVLSQLAKALEGTDQVDEAARLLREALSLAEGAPRPDPYVVCLCRNNLGANRLAAGEVDAARAEFEWSRQIAARAFGESHVMVAEVDVNLGRVALAGGATAEAEARFRSASKTVGAAGGRSHRHAEVLAYLARTLARGGKKEEARGFLEAALTIREAALRDALRLALSERERLAIVQGLRFNPESRAWPGALDTYLELGPTLGVAPDAQYARLLAWKGTIARQPRKRPEDLEDDPETRRLARELDESVRALRLASNEKPDADGGRRERLDQLEDKVDNLERRLRAISPRFSSADDAAGISPAVVGAAIPPGWALLDVIEIQGIVAPGRDREAGDGRRYLGFLQVPGRPVVRVDLGEARPIERAIRAFHLAIDSPDDSHAGPAGKLAVALRDPVLPHLAGVGGLIVAGDGLLHRLPWSALPGAEAGSFWIQSMAFAAVPSAQSLVARKRADRPTAAGALVVGDVDYGPMSRTYPALPMTGPEAASVADRFRATHPGATIDLLARRDSNEGAVKRILPGRRFVHVATHGYFHVGARAESRSETFGLLAGLDSGLVLAPGPAGSRDDPDDDQLLTADEVGRLDLRGVGLVVLSACSSGLGHISSGQGVIGLIGAFDRAGVGAVVCSLWKVDDAATAALMTAFYRHLWEDRPPIGPAQALRAAQCDLIRSRDATGGPAFSHPRFWAAFIVSGDPERIPETGPAESAKGTTAAQK